MADPITATMAGVSMASSIAGGYYGMEAAETKAQAKYGMYSYQAGIAKQNEKFQRWNAKEAIRSGETEAMQLGQKQAQRMGMIRAAQGASGVDMNSGTSVKVRESQEMVDRADQAMVRKNAMKKAYAYEVAAAGEDAQAKLYGMAADNALIEGKYEKISSLIGAASSVSSKWTQAKSAGVF